MNPHQKSPALVILVTALASFSLSAAAESDAESDVRDVRPGVYVGFSSCANGFCHGSTEALDDTAVLQNEYPTWMVGPHRKAYQTLRGDLSGEIAEALEGPGAIASEMKICLDCHALNVPDNINDGVYMEDGISCEACHGAAGGWRDRHFEENWSYRQSLRAGLIDLRDPETRGEVCLTCHLGDATKTVNHRLIAAGHPRLFFELDNATGAVPRHWKLDARRPGRKASHGVRAWAVGQAVTFQTGLEQLSRHASDESTWPEFSEYGCQSCHHSLAGSTWRQQPGYRFRGGLPRWSTARYSVLRFLIEAFAEGELADFDTAVEELARQASGMRRPGEVAKDLTERLDAVTERLAGVRWSEGEVRGMMARLVEGRETFLADIASAEQLAFALQSLMSRWVELDRKQLRSPLVGKIDAIFAELDDPDAFDRASFASRVADLAEHLD